jgi:NADH-quinone oxidoreductase subunit M
MTQLPILSLLIFLPVIGALVLMLLVKTGTTDEQKAQSNKNAKILALSVSILTFAASLYALFKFDSSASGFQFSEKLPWITGYDINYHLGVDGISMLFIVLTTFLSIVCFLASWDSIKERVKLYLVSFLLLEALTIGVFCSLDFVLFYFFFEASLIPMFLIIGIWGGENRIYASLKFFLYTLLGSVFLLLALIYLYTQFQTTDVVDLFELAPTLPLNIQMILWFAFFASFAVKVPMVPFHTWLPDAHVQAPTAGSIILAGILLKLGAYGFIRFSLPMLPDATHQLAYIVYILSIIAVIYTSLVALMQEDMKKMIAYSSIAHMGFVTAGIFALNQQSIDGAIFQSISHGLVSGALFFGVGVLYDRLHTKKIDAYGGVATVMPKFAVYFMLFTMASIGLPGTSGFVGEFLIMLGVFKDSVITSALIATGVVLGAAYMLWLYKRVVFGEIVHEEVKTMPDLNAREVIIFLMLAVPTIFFGIKPNYITDITAQPVKNLVAQLGGVTDEIVDNKTIENSTTKNPSTEKPITEKSEVKTNNKTSEKPTAKSENKKEKSEKKPAKATDAAKKEVELNKDNKKTDK